VPAAYLTIARHADTRARPHAGLRVPPGINPLLHCGPRRATSCCVPLDRSQRAPWKIARHALVIVLGLSAMACHEVNGGQPIEPSGQPSSTTARPPAQPAVPQATPVESDEQDRQDRQDEKVPPVARAEEGAVATGDPPTGSQEAPQRPASPARNPKPKPKPRPQAAAGPTAPQDCAAAIARAAKAAVEANGACTADSDCVRVALDCQRGCGSYVRADRVEVVRRAVRDATAGRPCRCPPSSVRCAKAAPACIVGRCGHQE